jgi:hypothetical protein
MGVAETLARVSRQMQITPREAPSKAIIAQASHIFGQALARKNG